MIVFGLAAVNKSVFVSACPLFHVWAPASAAPQNVRGFFCQL